MEENILSNYPDPADLIEWYNKNGSATIHKVNGHFHTPFSFSAFENLNQVFRMARDEDVKVLGINDFFTTKGYTDFYKLSLANFIFPLFNIEFIGLLKEEQQNNIRVNDPNNPGRIYFSGKGLKYPFYLEKKYIKLLDSVIKENMTQVSAMTEKVNESLRSAGSGIRLYFNEIREKYAKNLVRERHIAKALRIKIYEEYKEENQIKAFLNKLYSGKESKVKTTNHAALENEIRSNLLKKGGAAFVEENEKAFLSIDNVIKIILNAGGIPCYPLLLDDKNGRITDYEKDKKVLSDKLKSRNIYCIEFIPGRNDFFILKEYVNYFRENGFILTFGTEHNTPDRIPLTVSCRNEVPLDDELLRISFEGACVIAAHQYLNARGEMGYINRFGVPGIKKKDYFINLGKAVIEKYLASSGK
jgi:hypothetical protein